MVTGRLRASPDSNLLTQTLLKWIVLYVPVRWPHGILTRPEIDQELRGTKPVDFAADVAQVEALTDLVTATRRLGGQRHPIFGKMSDAAWLRWAYLHMDHHLRQFGA
jgi:hypothetical protein